MSLLYPPTPWCEWCYVWRLATPPGSTSPTLFEQWWGFFYVPQEPGKCKCCETGPTIFRPYPRRLESLTVCRCHYSRQELSQLSQPTSDITLYQQSLANIQTVRSLNSVQTGYFCLVIIVIFRGWILTTICNKKLASLPSLALCFQPRFRPFVWLLARTWIGKNTDYFAV